MVLTFLTGVPLLSAILEVFCDVGDCPNDAVGLFGSPGSKRALGCRPLAPLPAPDEASDDMLCLFVLGGPALRPSSAIDDSCGVAVLLGGFPTAPGVPCLLDRSSGYGSGPLGGGEVGAPYIAAALGGTRYAAHCWVGC